MEYVVKLYVAGEHYLEQLELQLDLDQPVHQNSSHLLVDGTAQQVVSFNSAEGLHRSEKKKSEASTRGSGKRTDNKDRITIRKKTNI